MNINKYHIYYIIQISPYKNSLDIIYWVNWCSCSTKFIIYFFKLSNTITLTYLVWKNLIFRVV